MGVDASHSAADVDKVAIIELLSRFHHAVDAKDWAALQQVMTTDAVAEYHSLNDVELFGLEGRFETLPTIIDWIRQGQEPFQFNGAPTHFMTNHVVSVEGNEAASNSYFFDLDLVSGRAIGTGFYKCRHLRTAEGWRIVELRLEQRLCDEVLASIMKQRESAQSDR